MSESVQVNPRLRLLAVIARLLDYPTLELQEAAKSMLSVIEAETRLDDTRREELARFTRHLGIAALLDIQADYIELFDRGRAHSLLLFEHVHGESRDRGQAMVDLLEQYRAGGLELDAKELPDYIPLYLEYLSTRSEEEAAQGLGDVHPILSLLSARLQKRGSPYHLLFDALLALIDIEPDMKALHKKVAAEQPDDTPAELDKVWEEEMVNFVDDQGASCPSQRPRQTTHTLHFREN